MPALTQANIEPVIQACQSKLEAIAQSLNQCFDTTFQLALGESQPLATARHAPDLDGPGVVVAFCVGQTALLCAISAALPLPKWYTEPDENQISRLETLAMEWTLNCLPDDMVGENSVSFTVPVLNDCLASAEPVDGAIRLPLLVVDDRGEPVEKIWLIWPARRIPVAADADPAPAPTETPKTPDRAAMPKSNRPTHYDKRRGTLDRLRRLPVPIIVKLAEKKIELGQLLAVGPGAIITFEKSCEDLLDLYVNNQLYCRGEAVKIGEKFGIKICEVGSAEERASAVLAVE
jgi:flagellar motor switch protein FliN/FliY